MSSSSSSLEMSIVARISTRRAVVGVVDQRRRLEGDLVRRRRRSSGTAPRPRHTRRCTNFFRLKRSNSTTTSRGGAHDTSRQEASSIPNKRSPASRAPTAPRARRNRYNTAASAEDEMYEVPTRPSRSSRRRRRPNQCLDQIVATLCPGWADPRSKAGSVPAHAASPRPSSADRRCPNGRRVGFRLLLKPPGSMDRGRDTEDDAAFDAPSTARLLGDLYILLH